MVSSIGTEQTKLCLTLVIVRELFFFSVEYGCKTKQDVIKLFKTETNMQAWTEYTVLQLILKLKP